MRDAVPLKPAHCYTHPTLNSVRAHAERHLSLSACPARTTGSPGALLHAAALVTLVATLRRWLKSSCCVCQAHWLVTHTGRCQGVYAAGSLGVSTPLRAHHISP